MKKKTMKNLKSLEKNGWEISTEDKAAISKAKSDIAFSNDIKSLVAENRALSAKIEHIAAQNAKQMTAGMHGIHDALLKEKNWEFDIRRNKSGYISKVFAKQISS